MKSELALMSLIKHHKMPLCAFESIMQWAKICATEYHHDFSNNQVRGRETVMNDLFQNLNISDKEPFKPKVTTWLPDNTPYNIYVCSFQNAIYSLLSNKILMSQENLSFPNKNTPLSPYHNDRLSMDSEITELHHGKWWTDTWSKQCKKNKREMLVPIIMYMDGIAIDQNGRLTLTPLNFTLGIFNSETRKKPEAWETLYFHPDHSYMSTFQKSKSKGGFESMQNLHNALSTALESFKNVCDNGGLFWNELEYSNQTFYDITMKFAIAFVVGDTELHDKLCGKYAARGKGVKMICRHCNCPTENCVNPNLQHKYKIFKPEDFDPSHMINNKEYFKECSHHPINNAFHQLNFGSNPHNIHIATHCNTLK